LSERLAPFGIEVPPGGNVLSIYQQMLMREGVHPFQVYARNELMRRGIDVPPGENPLEAYARNELTRRGIDVPPGENVLSLFQRIRMMENN
jgi:hypothetical protein